MKDITFYSLLIILWSTFSTCSSIHIHPSQNRSGEELFSLLREKSGDIISIKGIAKFAVSSGRERVESEGVILTRRPSYLRLESIGPFGSPIDFLVTDGGSFTYYNALSNEVISGNIDEFNDHRLFRALPDVRCLMDVVHLYMPYDKLELCEEDYGIFSTKNREIHLCRKDGKGVYIVWPGLSCRYIDGYSLINEQGKIEVTVKYNDYNTMAGLMYPGVILADFALEGLRVEISFIELKINERIEDEVFELRLPEQKLSH